MNSKEITNLMLAYQAVYDEELREEFEEINEDFFGVDYLTEENLEDIAEEVIYEMLHEGYDINDIEDIFDEFVIEAKVTYGHDTEKPAGRLAKVKGAFKGALGKVRDAVNASQEKARESAIKSTERANARRDAVKSAVGGLKDKLTGKINKVGSAVKAGVKAAKKELSGEAEKESKARITGYRLRKAAKSQAAKASAGNPFSEPSKPSEPSKSSEKPSDPWKGSETNPKKPTLKVTTTSTKALPPGRTTKTGKPLTKSQSDMQIAMKNRKLTQRLGEEVEAWVNSLIEEGYDLSEYTWDDMFEIYEQNIDESDDLYDVILSHLLDEGYAESVEQAEVIMVNMSEEWRNSIVEQMTVNVVDVKGGTQAAKNAQSGMKGKDGQPLYKPGVGVGPDFKLVKGA